jgi:hypothetical protein
MKRDLLVLATAIVVAALPAIAKLPPPSPEERAAAEQKRAREQAQVEREKADLQRAQERVAQRYRGQSRNTSARTDPDTLPKSARELPRDAGPQGDKKPSAEAHSAPVK